jgi:hypothetical protein
MKNKITASPIAPFTTNLLKNHGYQYTYNYTMKSGRGTVHRAQALKIYHNGNNSLRKKHPITAETIK